MRRRAAAGQRDRFWHSAPLFADPRMRAWLIAPGSLTARVAAHCGDFSFRLLRQGRMRVAHEEASLLGLRATQYAYARDVLMCCGSEALVYAHSVLRYADLRGAWRMVAGMGARPLGSALFADAEIQRSGFSFRRLARTHPLYCAAAKAVGKVLPPLSARRSLFWSRGAPLLVTEVFLPTIAGLPTWGRNGA